ncbi:MAG TPA: AAA family ATPase, partial [Gemmatimonadaceae bacterium]|nr:AAA family ATPase [Gemmatimonadaceae bacterium]
MSPAQARVFPLPLVGRQGELARLREALNEAAAKRGGTVLLCGEGGIGKSRLAQATLEEAAARGWTTVVGRAYVVETGVPYALFADALVPLLRGLDAGARQVLTRGGDAELARLFPALHPGGAAPTPADGNGAELKARLLWACAQLLTRLAARQPVLLVLENLHWADASSLELLHFIARHAAGERLLLLCTYIDAAAEHDAPLRATERSLASLGAAVVHRLAPLSRDDTAALLQTAFGADPEAVRDFTTLLYGWTRGNPFFIEEILKALVESGRLYEREGRWLGWEVDALELPRSVRDAVLARLDRLPPAAREVANVAAVLGTHTGYDVLRAVSALSDAELLTALDELRGQQVLVERDDAHEAVYDFAHPMLQEVLYAELGKARARRLHALVAEALESHFGARAQEHAGELAFHFARAEPRVAGPKAVRYLAAAGQAALATYANREAAGYLQTALDQVERLPEPTGLPSVAALSDDLARARQRLGETDPARLLLERARARAERDGDLPHVAALARRLGLLEFWCGNFADALRHYETGVAAAQAAGARDTLARLRLTQGSLLLALGHRDEARLRVEEALQMAEAAGDAALLARVHRALLLLHAWTGPPERGREHGRRAAALAAASGQRAVEWSVHWGLAMLEGLTGNAHAAAHHLAESERIADELRSPLLRLWSAEVAIEYRSGVGDFAASLAVGEPAIASARAFGLRTLLPRLLVWTGNVYLQRGDEERARALLTEAWELSRAGDARRQPLDVHTVVPAYTGMALLYNLTHEHARAREM